MSACPCGSGDPYAGCCGLYHDGLFAPTAIALMRSRYCAFVKGAIDYLIETHDPETVKSVSRESLAQFSRVAVRAYAWALFFPAYKKGKAGVWSDYIIY